MAQAASPIDIATPPRFGSNSPQNQTSNLTSALREAGATRNTHHDTPALQQNGTDMQRPSLSARNDSISGSFYGTGARPISMKDRPRRESNAMNSLVNGLSWGGVSVGSWIRDE
jgi:transcription factor SFP1